MLGSGLALGLGTLVLSGLFTARRGRLACRVRSQQTSRIAAGVPPL